MDTRENNEKYISISKQNIYKLLTTYKYRKAFWLLILFLERLDGEDKTQVIDYYSKNMQQCDIFDNHFQCR